ncbi:MAG: hypothetical protein AAFX54_03115 [Pseudomonadota bacterium]
MPSRKKHNQPLRLSLFAATALFITAPAHACYTVHVDNQSTKDITAIWTAFGCAGMDHWKGLACNQKAINAGESKSYNYNWGVSTPSIFLFQELTLDDKLKKEVSYGYEDGKFKLDNGATAHMDSPGGCGGSYTIAFTEDVRKKWLER